MRGFKNFLMRGDVIVVAVGLVVALAFSMLITAFVTYIINPIVAAAGRSVDRHAGQVLTGVGSPNTVCPRRAWTCL